MKRLWASALILSLAASAGRADETDYRPGAGNLGKPVGLGAPVLLDAPPPAAATLVARGQSPDPPRPVAASLGQPITAPPLTAGGVPLAEGHWVPADAPDPRKSGVIVASAPPAPPPLGLAPAAPPLPPPGLVGGAPPGLVPSGGMADGGLFGCGWLGCLTSPQRSLFQSDHCFDGFISPISNPFLFEDPRSLTEVRPIFIYQHTPRSNYAFQGSNIEFFGAQFRLAITDRLSFVFNKLGGIWTDPHDPFPSGSGLAELNLGAKYTFYRNEDCGTVAAAGFTFQIPAGPDKVYQDTGSVSFVPYVSVAQNFFRSEYGSFNFLGTTGYAFADTARSEYYFLSTHLDYDVGNLHKIYPLLEVNWYQYMRSGNSHPFGFEGRDLINFGSTGISGTGSVSLATGARYKFNETLQTGLALEFPLTSNKDLLNFRLMADVIFRY